MRTRALRVTIGAYEAGDWHVAAIEDIYDRGVHVDSVMIQGPVYCSSARLLGVVQDLTVELMKHEAARVAEAAGGTRASRQVAASAS